MKMVKSLLLGSAAGLLAVAGAQAADLPVKAKPVEYVKVCSLYGAGFFYIPGTDTCLKIGGFVRAEYMVNASGSHGQYWDGTNALYNRYTNDSQTRTRFNYTFDTRTQTEYGTLRSYIRAGVQWSSPADTDTVYLDRAFIQLAGFTFGNTVSFFDFQSGGGYSISSIVGASDTGGGTNVAAYTATFGNGFSGTIAIEDGTMRRKTGLHQANAILGNAGAIVNDYGGHQIPDIVGNLRVDQAWGSAQVMAALHQVRAAYFNDIEGLGAPDDKFGFAVGGGLKVNLPWAAGDSVGVQVTYAQGASNYARLENNMAIYSGTQVFEGLAVDGVWDGATNSGIELTKVWGVNAGIEHYWTPMLRTSLFGGYATVDFSGTATNLICSADATVVTAGCNPDWSMWQIGTKSVWNPVKNLDVSLEVVYSKFENENAAGYTRNMNPGGSKPNTNYSFADQEVFSGILRVQRNFWP